ncbi:MAG: glycosyltransferase 87 family protein [Cellulomonas sp.]
MAESHPRAAPGFGAVRHGTVALRPHAFPEDPLSPDRLLKSRGAVWTAFVVAHAWITFMGVQLMFNSSFHDVDLYRYWMWLGDHLGQWPVLSSDWVYPAGAIVPMLIPAAASTTNGHTYALAWCAMVMALDALAVVVLLRHRRSTAGVWWWMAFMVLLGPVSMGRLDAIIVPVMIVALAVLLSRPRLAAALLTAGAWIKVAPGAILIPLVLVTRRPWRDVVVPAGLVSVFIVLEVAVGGGTSHLTSFLTEQGTRGLQIESVGATPWVLAGLFTTSVTRYFNQELVTWEITGPGSNLAVDVLGLALPLGIALLAALFWWLHRRAGTGMHLQAFLVRAALLVLLVLIVLNKVGSPQYLAWLASPVALALALRLPGWRSTAWQVAALAILTQIVFPLDYSALTVGHVPVSLVLVARNVLLVVLLVETVRDLVRDSRRSDDTYEAPELVAGDAVRSGV